LTDDDQWHWEAGALLESHVVIHLLRIQIYDGRYLVTYSLLNYCDWILDTFLQIVERRPTVHRCNWIGDTFDAILILFNIGPMNVGRSTVGDLGWFMV